MASPHELEVAVFAHDWRGARNANLSMLQLVSGVLHWVIAPVRECTWEGFRSEPRGVSESERDDK